MLHFVFWLETLELFIWLYSDSNKMTIALSCFTQDSNPWTLWEMKINGSREYFFMSV